MTPLTNKSIEYIDTINPITAHRLPDKKGNAEFQTSSTAVPLKKAHKIMQPFNHLYMCCLPKSASLCQWNGSDNDMTYKEVPCNYEDVH